MSNLNIRSIRLATPIAIGLIVILFVILYFNRGCGFNRLPQLPNIIESYVIVGLDRYPKCASPFGVSEFNRELSKGRPLAVWVKSIFNSDYGKTFPNMKLKLSIVDSLGRILEEGKDFQKGDITLNPQEIITNNEGVYYGLIAFQSNIIGTYRIRADFDDKRQKAFSLSPNIIVIR